MTQYDILFSRYDSKSGEMRLSRRTFLYAETFGDAFGKGSLMVDGMREGDPEREYKIAEISVTRQLHRAVNCEGGIHLFETADELTVRLAAKREG